MSKKYCPFFICRLVRKMDKTSQTHSTKDIPIVLTITKNYTWDSFHNVNICPDLHPVYFLLMAMVLKRKYGTLFAHFFPEIQNLALSAIVLSQGLGSGPILTRSGSKIYSGPSGSETDFSLYNGCHIVRGNSRLCSTQFSILMF